ncbi:DEAD/DEAH box helicase [Bacillus tianshenii]|nr:DEAD/DEAH box helicase [Bacillus tianshenii]
MGHIVTLKEVLHRAEECILQEILGSQTIRILTTLDSKYRRSTEMKSLIFKLYKDEEILLNKNLRNIVIDLLKVNEVQLLGNILGIKFECSNDLYKKLKITNFKRGSSNEEVLFNFFNMYPPKQQQDSNEKEEENKNLIANGHYSLFTHQRLATLKVKKLLSERPYRALLHMPTGAGKTRTAMNIICDYLRNNEKFLIVWLAATEELCQQAAEEFEKAWSYLGDRELKIHKFWGSRELNIEDIDEGIIIAGLPKIVSVTTRKNGVQFITKLANKCSLIVIDEAHQAIARTYKLVLDLLFYGSKRGKLLGLSATPGRTWDDIEADEQLSKFFAKRKVKLEVEGYKSPVDYLVEQGYLAKANFVSLINEKSSMSEKDAEQIQHSKEITLEVLKKLGKNEKRNLKIVQKTEELTKEHNRIILFAPSVECSNMLSKILSARGYHSYSLTGETSNSIRVNIINDFKNDEPKPKILCNYGVLTTGFDAPKTSAAIIGRPTLSLVLYSQMVGRAIRGIKAGGNETATIVTIIDPELPGFGDISDSFNNWEDVWG